MPAVARFDGIVIAMYHSDHPPPHFHASYGEHIAVFEIDSLELLRGFLPPARRRQVVAWAETRQALLMDRFRKARAYEKLELIP